MSTSFKLTDSVTDIPLIGGAKAGALERIGVRTILDLLYHIPASYRDTSEVIDIEILKEDGVGTVEVEIEEVRLNYTRGRKAMVKAKVADTTGSVNVLWFNQPYMAKALKKGQTYLMELKLPNKSGAKDYYCKGYEIMYRDGEQTHLGILTPTYHQTEGISSKWLRARFKAIRSSIKGAIKDHLSNKILKELDLVDIATAFELVHFPDSKEDLEKGQKRIALEELLELSYKLEQRREEREEANAKEIKTDKEFTQDFNKTLPFSLTKDQETVIGEILDDISKPTPMNRLLNGDVGSGKTAVAAAAALATYKAGLTTIIMAPTTILAQQHYESFNQLWDDIPITLMTGKSKQEPATTPQVIIGTHAILYKQELPKDIGLVIIDEQHRFGVEQREQLVAESEPFKPHYLTMTATPIPRTLTNVIYGDMDVSVIEQMPSNRKPIITHFVTASKQTKGLQWVADQIRESDNKGQAYIIFPLIDDSQKSDLKAATESHAKLSKSVFKDFSVGLLHGRLKEQEKQEILKDFNNKKYNILISTTVVEVGIDVTDATIMVIENAERFGLAQLHQLRGRVGRGDTQSYCLIFPSAELEEGSPSGQRLQFFANEVSGFKVAEYDLQSRGPGEVYGLRQSGVPNFKVADITNLGMIKEARQLIRDNKDIKPPYGLLEQEDE